LPLTLRAARASLGAIMRLKNHKIEGVEFIRAKLRGGLITPTIVVLHDTAGRLDEFNSRNYLADTDKASVQFVVERDGKVSQLVETNRRAGHAGQSTYHGKSDCNDFSIGIEIVNPGKLTRTNGGGAISWFGQEFGYGSHQLADMETPEHGKGAWMPYPAEQIDGLITLLLALFAGIPTLKDITTHWYISPGRKIDTNPLFPLESIRARVLGRDDPALIEAEAGSAPAREGEYIRVNAVSGLNVRRWPSFNPNVLGTAPDGAELPVLRRGNFGGQEWLLTRFGGHEGWIVARYTQPST
jgi:N-acetylmuramoyl-L-alanine amidase